MGDIKINDDMAEKLFKSCNSGYFSENWFINRDIICSKSILDNFSKFLKLPNDFKIAKLVWKKIFFKLFFENSNEFLMILLQRGRIEENEELSLVKNCGDYTIWHKGKNKIDYSNSFKHLNLENFKTFLSETFLNIFLDENSVIRYNNKIYKNAIKLNFNEHYYFFWGRRESKHLFFSYGLYNTRIGGRLFVQYESKYSYIQHRDYECRMMGEHQNKIHHNSVLDISNLSYSEPCKKSKYGNINKNKSSMLDTSESVLYDEDLINGGNKNLINLIEKIHSKNPKEDIYINCCCTPLIIGDDINGIARRLSSEKKCIIASNRVGDTIDGKDSPKDNFLLKYKNSISEYKQKRVQKSPNYANLVGFPEGKILDELIAMLSKVGLKYNSHLIPKISENRVLESLKAELNVLYPNENYKNINSEFFEQLPTSFLYVPPPFGFKRTFEWISRIAEFFGIRINDNHEWRLYYGSLFDKFEKLRILAKNHTIGLVLSKYDVERVVDESKSFESIPLLPLLEDMGFNLSILIYSERNEFISLKSKLYEKIDIKHEIKYCVDSDEIGFWLSRKDIDIIYSDYAFDERISRSGKNRFSISIGFEMGFEGAIRNINKVLKIASHKFNKKNNAFFSDNKEIFNDYNLVIMI